MTQDKTPKAIFNVLLSNGERMAHVYDVSSNYDKALEFTETMIGAITGALTRPSDDLYRGIVAAHRINGYPC